MIKLEVKSHIIPNKFVTKINSWDELLNESTVLLLKSIDEYLSNLLKMPVNSYISDLTIVVEIPLENASKLVDAIMKNKIPASVNLMEELKNISENYSWYKANNQSINFPVGRFVV